MVGYDTVPEAVAESVFGAVAGPVFGAVTTGASRW